MFSSDMHCGGAPAVTERILRVREQYRQAHMACGRGGAHSYGNHPVTLYWLEGYLAARDAPTTLLRRSYAEVREMELSRAIFSEGELIAGHPDLEPRYEQKQYYDSLIEKFKMSPNVHPDGRSDHLALDYRKLLRVGVNGLILEIEAEKQNLTFSRESMTEDIEKEEFFDGSLIELRALISYARRYSQALFAEAEKQSGDRREELLRMARNMARVPAEPAQTFWQALMSIHFYTFGLRGLYSAGRPDQDLLPYYEADIRDGRLTREFAQELIDNYCLGFALFVTPDTAAGMMICGTDEDGRPVENELSWMFLRAVDHIRMPDPNLALCVSKSTSPEILRYAMDMIGRGCAFPSFWNDEVVVRGMMANGFSPSDSHRYINSTCVELTVIGKSQMWTTCPYHNLAALLLKVFMEGAYPDYESLEAAFLSRVKRAFREENHKINRLKLERSRNASEAMRHSCLIDDCIRRGKNAAQGGAFYAATLPNVLGFANAIDALSAVRELVYRKGEVTLAQYREAVRADFEGAEALRQRIINRTPHYGNGDADVDSIAMRLAKCLEESCEGLFTFTGDRVIPGNFSYNYHEYYGRTTPATPDGRKGGLPLSDSCGPAQGRDTASPTAALRSGTCWEQGKFLGGIAQNIRLSRGHFDSEDKAVPIALLKGFFARGGVELQFNCVDRAELEDAVIHPELHRDLLVRVGGYSDFFVRMNTALQHEIMERTDY